MRCLRVIGSWFMDHVEGWRTPAEAVIGGTAAGATGLAVTHVSSNETLSFMARHGIPAIPGSAGFASAAAFLKYSGRYHQAKKLNPELTVKQFVKLNGGEAAIFSLRLFIVGGAAFTWFTSVSEILKNQNVNSFLSGGLSSLSAAMLFTLLGNATGLNPDKAKVEEIMFVFLGFALGEYGVQKILGLEGITEVQQTLTKILLAPLCGAVMAQLSTLFKAAGSALYESCRGSQPLQSDEAQSLLGEASLNSAEEGHVTSSNEMGTTNIL